MPPLVPDTITEYEPADPLHDSVDFPEPAETLGGFSVQLRADPPETELARLTVPVKPFTELIVTFEIPWTPARTVSDTGLAETVKS